MNRLFTTCMVLGCLSFSFAQGLQGNVTLGGQETITVTGHAVTLTLNASPNSTSYNIYRGTTSGGPYLKVAFWSLNTSYPVVQVNANHTHSLVKSSIYGTDG